MHGSGWWLIKTHTDHLLILFNFFLKIKIVCIKRATASKWVFGCSQKMFCFGSLKSSKRQFQQHKISLPCRPEAELRCCDFFNEQGSLPLLIHPSDQSEISEKQLHSLKHFLLSELHTFVSETQIKSYGVFLAFSGLLAWSHVAFGDNYLYAECSSSLTHLSPRDDVHNSKLTRYIQKA